VVDAVEEVGEELLPAGLVLLGGIVVLVLKGRPVSLDAEDYKHRNVERFFNRMKNWRGLASRYDKLAVVFRGSVVLAAIVDWLR